MLRINDVKFLQDGCTALKIALDAKHKEIAVLLYAQMNFFSATVCILLI